MGEEPVIDVANVFGVGQFQHSLDPKDALLLEPGLRSVTPAQQAARDVAEAIRGLNRELETTLATIEDLSALTGQLDALRIGLVKGIGTEKEVGNESVAVYQAHRLRERSPFIGRANPVALPLMIEFVDGGVDAVVTFGTLYEGPPGCLHGGYIAGIFDEVLGAAQTFSGQAGMTGRLTIHYRSPTPLNTELHLRARLEKVSGRKILCKGTLHAGERLCAEAEGLFIAVDPKKFFNRDLSTSDEVESIG
ncbi:MAG: PaaI family thioesterase [Acidimicrobiales bacterium]